MTNLQESIKRGQKEFNEKFAGILGHPLHARQSVERFLATFARSVAEEALEAIRLQEQEPFVKSYEYKRENIHDVLVHTPEQQGYNEAVQTQSQLINNYLKGEEDERN